MLSKRFRISQRLSFKELRLWKHNLFSFTFRRKNILYNDGTFYVECSLFFYQLPKIYKMKRRKNHGTKENDKGSTT